MREIRRILKRVIATIIVLCVIVGFGVMLINSHVVNGEKDKIVCAFTEKKTKLTSQDVKKLKRFNGDCILILGAGIKDRETPSPMLKDRLDAGIALYKEGVAPKILLSGDNGTLGHNELHVMLSYVKKAKVPVGDIFCDHAGFSTYDSMYRAKSIFGAEKIIVVTQTYHEYRALYIGRKLNLDVIGVASDQEKYAGQYMREIREIAARNKDFFMSMLKPESELSGEQIPINGDGRVSQGE